jgi:hypothetical protein
MCKSFHLSLFTSICVHLRPIGCSIFIRLWWGRSTGAVVDHTVITTFDVLFSITSPESTITPHSPAATTETGRQLALSRRSESLRSNIVCHSPTRVATSAWARISIGASPLPSRTAAQNTKELARPVTLTPSPVGFSRSLVTNCQEKSVKIDQTVTVRCPKSSPKSEKQKYRHATQLIFSLCEQLPP